MNLKMLILSALISVTSYNALASEKESQCSYITTAFHGKTGKVKTISLTSHNGKYFNKPKMKIAVAPGLHRFTAQKSSFSTFLHNHKHQAPSYRRSDDMPTKKQRMQEVMREEPRNEKKSANHNKTALPHKGSEIEFQITVTEDQQYRLVASDNKAASNALSSELNVLIRSIKQRSCVSDSIFPALDTPPQAVSTELPEHLQIKLDILSADIQAYMQTQDPKGSKYHFQFASHIANNLGLILEPSSENRINVRFIVPKSLASTLGLKTGDIINEIAGLSLKNKDSYNESLNHFKNALFNRKPKQELLITVMRGGALIHLRSTPPSLIIPSTSLSIE